MENWIPTNCSRSARKSNDRYSSSFVFNNTRDGLNEDTFPNPGEAEAVKHSSVFVEEDVTLCWIETITIKEDKSIKPPKKVVLREFTISFENSATIPEKYLECGKLEGEVEPGCHNHGEKSGLFDVIDEDSKVSKLVNFTTVSNKGNIEVRQHKNVRCAVGPVVTKNIIEFKDGSKNPKKRVEVKVSPRLRRMSEAGETCPSDEEKIDISPKIKPGVKDLSENIGDTKGKSNEFDKARWKTDGRLEELGEKPEEKPGRIHDKPEEVPDMMEKKPEEKPHFITEKPIGEHLVSRRPSKFDPSTLDETIPHYNEENDKVKPVGEIANGSSSTYKKDDITEIGNPSPSGSPETPEGVVKDKESTPDEESLGDGDESCEGKSCKSEGYTQPPQYANTRKALKPSSESKNTSEESITTKETKPKKDEIEGREPKSESCEGDSCEKCSAEDCSTELQSTEDSTPNKSVLDKPNKDISREDKVRESSVGQQTPRPEIDDDDNLRYSTTEKPPTDVIIPTDRVPSVDTETSDDRNIEKNKEDEYESCPGGNCSTKLDESRTGGPTTKKSEDEAKKKLIPSDDSGVTTSRPDINQESENKSELCEGDCSTVPTKSSSKVDKEKMKPGNDKLRKSATVSPSNEEEKPSDKEIDSFPTTRKSSSRNIHPSDVETESVVPDMQEFEESEGHPTSLRPQKNETNIPDSWEEGTIKRPRNISSHNLVHMKEPEKDFKCESGSCSTSSDALSIPLEGATKSHEGRKDSHKEGLKSSLDNTEATDEVSEPEVRPTFPEDTSKSKGTSRSPESHKESSESPESTRKSSKYTPEAPESPESTTKPPKGIKKNSKDISKSPDSPESAEESLESPESISNSPKGTIKSESTEESSKSPESTTISFKDITNSKDKSKEAPGDELNIKAKTEYLESGIKYSETTSEPEEITEGTSQDLRKTSQSRSKQTAEKKRDKKERKHEPDDDDGMRVTYSDEEESSPTPSYVKTTISPEQQPRESTDGDDGDYGPDGELKNRSGEILLDRTPETTTEMSLIERTTPQCLPDNEECNSKSETLTSQPDSKNKEEQNKEINQSNPETELNINQSIPDILDNKSVSKSPSSGKHRLGLRIKILLEHIDENEERKNLVEVDKHLLLNEGANDHDNNTILNQIKALNDSVTAQTIKALLNCSTLEKLTKKGISIQVNEAALVPEGKEGSKNVEPNEFILSVEDKGPDGEKVANLRRKREINEDNFKDDNSTTISSTEENSTDTNTEESISTVENSSDTSTEVPTSTVENFTDTSTEDTISTVPNSTETNTEDPISTAQNSKETTTDAHHFEAGETIKNHSEIIKNYLPDLKRDINTGINHVISKLKNCTTLNCSQESAIINFLPISNILGIISDPKDSRTNSRNKRDTEDYRKEKHAFEKLDNWSNERIKRAAGGNHLRSLTEFTIFREA